MTSNTMTHERTNYGLPELSSTQANNTVNVEVQPLLTVSRQGVTWSTVKDFSGRRIAFTPSFTASLSSASTPAFRETDTGSTIISAAEKLIDPDRIPDESVAVAIIDFVNEVLEPTSRHRLKAKIVKAKIGEPTVDDDRIDEI